MTLDCNLSRLMRCTFTIGLLSTSTLVAALQISFNSPMGEEKWRVSQNPIRCGLSLSIPNYGVAYFEQQATKRPHFILRLWNTAQRTMPAQIIARPPTWKPGGQTHLVVNSLIKPSSYSIFLKRESTLKLLSYLSQGYQADFNYKSEEGFDVSVVLSPIRFQKVYSQYQRCLGDLLPFNYNSVKESVFHFDTDSTELTNADKDQLRRIAQYAEADTRIEKIRVLGYADQSGRNGYNNAISEFRAEAVKNYLLKIGVPDEKLYVTWFGELKPVARNDTDTGRAANRRVVVDLIQK